MSPQQRKRFNEFLRLERANLDALAVMHARMKRAMEGGAHHLLPEMRAECARLNAARYALDEQFHDVCNLVELTT